MGQVKDKWVRLQTADTDIDYRLQTTDYRLQTTDYFKLLTTGCLAKLVRVED